MMSQLGEHQRISDYDAERASNSYLMSLAVLMVGLPFPVINLIASALFYLNNRRSSAFVRWHCMQALVAQACTLPINAAAVYWTLRIVFGSALVTNAYAGYIATVLLFNLVEFIANVYSAVKTRKGIHVSWWFFGGITDVIVGK
jgi:hypothetical protein